MPRQIDEDGSKSLVQKVEDLGVQVHPNEATREIRGHGSVESMEFADGERLDVNMIIVSAGIRPRDDLARDAGLNVGHRDGIVVSDLLQTSDPDIFAIGECALHGGMIYGLIAPGWEMAEICAANFCGDNRVCEGTELSTKLNLLGVDVASFGAYELNDSESTSLTFEDHFEGIYKRLLFSKNGKKPLGGILVGDADDYGSLTL